MRKEIFSRFALEHHVRLLNRLRGRDSQTMKQKKHEITLVKSQHLCTVRDTLFDIVLRTELHGLRVLVEINRKLVQRHMVDGVNELFDKDGILKSEVVTRLQAKLIQESFVTGILYINLTAGHDVNEGKKLYGYREIPTTASIFAELSESINLEKLSKQVSSLMVTATTKISDLDLNKLSNDFSNTNTEIQSFLSKISGAYAPLGPKLVSSAEETSIMINEISVLTESLNDMLDPSSDFRFGFSTTMRDISAMSKSLKSLADLLERNPQAFISGKGGGAE